MRISDWSSDVCSSDLFNSAIFPGIQGGPLEHVIAAKAVAFGEALHPAFADYANRVVENAQVLAASLERQGYTIVSGGTDTHVVLVDLRTRGLTAKRAQPPLDDAGITCNKNGLPFHPEQAFVTSVLRSGPAALTNRGYGPFAFR